MCPFYDAITLRWLLRSLSLALCTQELINFRQKSQRGEIIHTALNGPLKKRTHVPAFCANNFPPPFFPPSAVSRFSARADIIRGFCTTLKARNTHKICGQSIFISILVPQRSPSSSSSIPGAHESSSSSSTQMKLPCVFSPK